MFSKKLTDALPPHRLIEFELTIKPRVPPSNRPPIRLPKVEQDALQQNVCLSSQSGLTGNNPSTSGKFLDNNQLNFEVP
ncbi:uncharacterized protein PHALS_00705 [Plasmopara halstedii]|uniref:Uncharacterized protein n=1 Tax=Plasmopara halstedii TaxID=4781 RepID=A0A0P1AT92_PLAHL|nr:uncharacterized protein PHALS_00705 [Plasmopara halstedii]CEG44336.1 hypothetical protein PHALS_00705 [Plasmopara halstedii]|eukprot:XP_024580705.1 hypothetical protein PHALS_00705 [Plasmopara halstedii]